MQSLRTRAEPVVPTWYQDGEGREPKPPERVPSALKTQCPDLATVGKRADGEHCVMDGTVAGASGAAERPCTEPEKPAGSSPHAAVACVGTTQEVTLEKKL